MEIGLKQRLVGASVIIALAVIFIPMIFDGANKNRNQSISIEIPGEPVELQHKVISIDNIVEDEPKNNSGENNSLIQKEETIIDIVDNSAELNGANKTIENDDQEIINEGQTVVQPIVKPIIVEPIVDEPIKIDIKNNDTTKAVVAYRVKLGSFSEQKNAQQLKARVIHSSHEAIIERDEVSGFYKVYTKTFSSLSEVESLSQKIQKLNLNIGKPSIETLDQQLIDDSELLLNTGWIIQIGIFSNKINSIKLRDKIRNKGYITFVDEILNNKGQTRYRVRVGPFATRDEAETKKNGIKKNMNLKGILKPHEKHKVINK